MPARDRIIADLRASIDKIERRPILAEKRGAEGAVEAGVPQVGAGTLNEVFSRNTRDAGAALGFALQQARGLMSPERPAIIFLQMRAEAQETGLPYGPGFLGFGLDPQSLALVRAETITEMLWAMEEAAGCRNVAAVIGDFARDHKALDFTASRRLSLRAEAFGVALFLMRYGAGREASAATFRWHVAAAPSAEQAFDRRAPGAMRYRVTLEKSARRLGVGAAGQDALGQDFWLLKWTEHGLVADGAFRGEMVTGTPSGDGTRQNPGGAALSVADAAGLVDRLPQTA